MGQVFDAWQPSPGAVPRRPPAPEPRPPPTRRRWDRVLVRGLSLTLDELAPGSAMQNLPLPRRRLLP